MTSFLLIFELAFGALLRAVAAGGWTTRSAPTWEDGSMSLLLRSVMATLPAYVAGRTVPGALKLASNETSYPLLPAVAARVSEALSSANRYPDPSQARITQALADRLGFTAGQVMVGCGSVAL
jgi:histidinol-phosphate aminotransferase